MALTVINTNMTQLLDTANKNSAGSSRIARQLTTAKRVTSGKDDPAGLIGVSLTSELVAYG